MTHTLHHTASPCIISDITTPQPPVWPYSYVPVNHMRSWRYSQCHNPIVKLRVGLSPSRRVMTSAWCSLDFQEAHSRVCPGAQRKGARKAIRGGGWLILTRTDLAWLVVTHPDVAGHLWLVRTQNDLSVTHSESFRVCECLVMSCSICIMDFVYKDNLES